MNLDTLTNAFRSLVTAPELRAILVDGPWGAGKTYFAKEFAKNNEKLIEDAKLRFAYVSLFGITSLSEVRSRICLSYGASDGWKNFAAKVKFPTSVAGFDLGNLGDLAKEYAEDRILKNLFVCIDDLERVEHNLKITEVLGLISELTQDRSCKCVLLLNSSGMKEADCLKKYSEKVFDLEIAFNPKPEEVIHIGLPRADWAAAALPVFQRMGYANIRVMQRVRWVLNEVNALRESALISKLWPSIVEQAAALCICHYGYRPMFGGSLEPLRAWSNMGYLVRKALPSQKGREDVELEWKELLVRMDYDKEPYDNALITLLETGTLPRDEMIAGLKTAAGAADRTAALDRYSCIWDQYRDNFSLDRERYHKLLFEFLSSSAVYLGGGELLSACEMMLELKADPASRNLAKQCLTRVVEKISDPFRKQAYSSYKTLVKSGIIRSIPFRPSGKQDSLEEIFVSLTGSGSFNPGKFSEFSAFSKKELEDFLLSYRGADLLARISEFFQRLAIAPEVDQRYALQQRMNTVLNSISRIDSLHKSRINTYIKKEIRYAQNPPPRPTTRGQVA